MALYQSGSGLSALVGIGTTNPASNLHVVGNVLTNNVIVTGGSIYGAIAGSNTIAAAGITGTTISGTTLYGAIAGSNTISATIVTASSNVNAPTMNSTTANGATVIATTGFYGPLTGSNAISASTISGTVITASSNVNAPTMNSTTSNGATVIATTGFYGPIVGSNVIGATVVTASSNVNAPTMNSTTSNGATVIATTGFYGPIVGSNVIGATVVTASSNVNAPTMNATTSNAGTFITTNNVYAANAIQTSNIICAGFTSNTTNTVFNFDTVTIPFVNAVNMTASGTIGVGTTSPAQTLVVQGTANVAPSGTTALFVTSGGFVGIGTTSPGTKFTVYTSGHGIRQDDGTIQVEFYTGGGAGWMGTFSNHPLYFYTNNQNQAMVIGTNNNVGIGTASPGDLLHVYSSAGSQIRVDGGSGGSGDPSLAYYSGVTFRGRVAYSTSGGYMYFQNNTQDVMRFYNGANGTVSLQPIGGSVGIGTTNPTYALQVIGTTWSTNMIASGTGTVMYISQNTGLGTTAGNSTSPMLQLYYNNGNASYLNIFGYRNANGTDWTTASTRIQQVIDVTKQAYIDFNPVGQNYGIGMYGSSGSGITVTQNGNVGIGTSPLNQLTVSNLNARTDTITTTLPVTFIPDFVITRRHGTAAGYTYPGSAMAFRIWNGTFLWDTGTIMGAVDGLGGTNTSGGLFFYTGIGGQPGGYLDGRNAGGVQTLALALGFDQRAYFAGNVGIGTTNPSYKLHVSNGDSSYSYFGPNGTWGAYLKVGTGTAYASSGVASINCSNGNLHLDPATGGYYIYFNYFNPGGYGANYGQVNSYGSFYNNGVGLFTGDITAFYSDERLKTKTGTLSGALDKVCSLDTFTYVPNELAKSIGYTDEKERLGLSAQQVQKVAPQVVCPAPIDIHEDGPNKGKSKSGENYLTVQYDKLVPLLIEAIKEEKKAREALEERIKILELK
jgi:Chaperone of endosialidase